MPLSEEELRMLEQMERALVREDPKFASTLRGTALRRAARRRSLIAVVFLLVGVGVLMAGAMLRMTVVGVAGFAIMVLSASAGLTSWQSGPASPAPGSSGGGEDDPRPPGRQPEGGSFLDKLTGRLRRRRDESDD